VADYAREFGLTYSKANSRGPCRWISPAVRHAERTGRRCRAPADRQRREGRGRRR
jgi:hypothetical protein